VTHPTATIPKLMSGAALHASPVGRFSDLLLAHDLPGLAADRRTETVDFIVRRANGLPSLTRLGVVVISSGVELIRRVAGPAWMLRVATGIHLPLLSEYPRLVRSLGYTYVWETWPDTADDGASA
jgi:hypothetical protein